VGGVGGCGGCYVFPILEIPISLKTVDSGKRRERRTSATYNRNAFSGNNLRESLPLCRGRPFLLLSAREKFHTTKKEQNKLCIAEKTVVPEYEGLHRLLHIERLLEKKKRGKA